MCMQWMTSLTCNVANVPDDGGAKYPMGMFLEVDRHF